MDYWNRNWLFEPIFDKEFKQYQILGFEQATTINFNAFRIFPYLENLYRQIKLVEEYRAAADRIAEGLKPKLLGLDLHLSELHYAAAKLDDYGMEEWWEVLDFADDRLRPCYDLALQQIEMASGAVHIRPIGLQDDEQRRGLLFVRLTSSTKVYRYESRVVRRINESEAYRDLRTTYIADARTSTHTDYAELKWHYLKSENVSGINAYLVETEMDLPFFECLLPLVKAKIMKID